MYKLVNDVILNINDVSEYYTIDTNVYCDSSLSQIYFDDFKREYVNETNQTGRYLDTTILLCGESIYNKAFNLKKLSRLKKSQLYSLYTYFHNYCEIDDLLKADYLDSLENETLETVLRTCIENADRVTEIDVEMKQFSHLLNVVPEIESIRGYSQGDYAIVIDCNNNNFSVAYLENLFFNTPLSATLDLIDADQNNVYTFSLSEHTHCEYSLFDKKDFLKFLSQDLSSSRFDDNMQKVILEYAECNITDEPVTY